jgi:predicted transcriptional regulator
VTSPNDHQKPTTVRLPDALAEDLAAVAETDGIPSSEAIRQAVAAHVAARRADPEFQARLRASIERNRRILERLATDPPGEVTP